MSSYLTINANTAICLYAFGLAASMASVWTLTKWPLISQYQARRERALIQRVLWPRIWLQTLTFLLLAGGVVFGGPILLRWVGSGKNVLPLTWILCLMLGGFLELQLAT